MVQTGERDIYVSLNISSDEITRWYAGEAHIVHAKSVDGRRVHFPANILRQFVTHQGVQGLFRISYSAEGKFIGITRHQ